MASAVVVVDEPKEIRATLVRLRTTVTDVERQIEISLGATSVRRPRVVVREMVRSLGKPMNSHNLRPGPL